MSTKFNRIISFETPSEHKSICLWNSSVDSYQNFLAIQDKAMKDCKSLKLSPLTVPWGGGDEED